MEKKKKKTFFKEMHYYKHCPRQGNVCPAVDVWNISENVRVEVFNTLNLVKKHT